VEGRIRGGEEMDEEMDVVEELENPRNLLIDKEHFYKLLQVIQAVHKSSMSTGAICHKAIYSYGGTLTEALIDFLYNKI
jgi:hypothetical protein